MKDEKKTVGISYIYSFYMNVQALTDTYSQYINLLQEFLNKYGQNSEKAAPQDNNVINEWTQAVRLHAHKCFIQYQTIVPNLKITQDPKLEIYYKEILKTFMIGREDIKNFVLAMNKVLVNDIIQELLTSNQEFIKDIYKNEGK